MSNHNSNHQKVHVGLIVFVSGSSEREDERGTQQASIRHGGSSPYRVERALTAPSEREDGCSGGEGELSLFLIITFRNTTSCFHIIPSLCP